MELHLGILPKWQRKLLPPLIAFKKDWYLAGGTALGLQIGHRESIDFDFFRSDSFDTQKLFESLQKIFPSCKKTFAEKNTLYVDVDDVKISFIQFPYPEIHPPLDSPFLRIAHQDDIAAMKLSAIQQRSTKKDYVDIYFLLQTMSISELCDCYFQKFWHTTTESLLRKYLTYFEDIEEVNIRMKKNISWKMIQKTLTRKATEI